MIHHLDLPCQKSSISPLAVTGPFLAAGTGSAIHVWKFNAGNQFNFHTYHNPRTGFNIKNVHSIGITGLLVSVDYGGNVHVWDAAKKELKHSLGCTNDAGVTHNKDVLVFAGSDQAKIYYLKSMASVAPVLLRELDFKTLVNCSKVSAMSYRLVTVAASISELYLVFNNDIVIVDVMGDMEATNQTNDE